ncbi:response regulator transcription factor [Achromobacter sp. Marseille-Q0513]|uniref:response regulator transcription factor n=1 Tax=Achromobacter sp. Marseille-Q0513 TaxID=2829161 RepID=UPI001B8E0C5C|nr:response regulator transcription factor [Achromobacter sp. Marseille-Q0513]MBR8653503.1 response regulator transcription factor [Achromobacter sp. Marseille-Q0513]
MKIAVLGGKREQAEVTAILLNAMGHECSVHGQGGVFLQSGQAEDYDFFVVDAGLSTGGMDPLLVGKVRAAAGRAQPILLLAEAADLESCVASSLDDGADDCMSKPVRAGELAARVGALLRRAYPDQALPADLIRVGDYEIDPVGRTAMLRGQPVKLSRREFDLGLYLFRHIGRLVPRIVLEKAIWGRSLEFDSKTLDTHVYRLRVKLQLQPENGLQLSSVYAQGFRLTPVMALAASQQAYA